MMRPFTDELSAIALARPVSVRGTVEAVSGLTVEVAELPLPVGASCRIDTDAGPKHRAEVIGFAHGRALVMPLTGTGGIARGDRVASLASASTLACSDALLGRVIDALGRPLDGKPDLPAGVRRPIDAAAVRPMDRRLIREPITTGVRAIDALHTCGRGQRMGLFAGPGVGKSTLLAQIVKSTDADVCVVALIGERGREVQEFIEGALGEDGLKRAVLIVATGDETPLMKVRAAKAACAASEFFRDQGKNVLLVMDSLTRLAQAQRQIGLAAREPPATKGFPPSVFALLPQILERAGKTAIGSVTGFYTVLVEGDDFNEPVPDAVKGITDGHLLLSRALANRGHFPAIDPLASISRVRGDVAPRAQVTNARKALRLLADYAEIQDLVSIGAYVAGASVDRDLAVELRPAVNAFLQQSTDGATMAASVKQLDDLCNVIEARRTALTTKKGN